MIITLVVYFLTIWTSGLQDLRSATARRLIFVVLVLVSILIIVAIETLVEGRYNQAATHMLGFLAVAVLAWIAKKLQMRRERE